VSEEFTQLLQSARDASASGQSGNAVDLYQRALALDPTNIAAIIGLGHGLRSLGQGMDAVRLYRDAIRLKPGSGAAWWALANMKTVPLDSDDLGLLRDELSRPQPSAINTALLCFSTGKALDDVGDTSAAFAAYVRGNAIMADVRPYQEQADMQLLEDLLAWSAPAKFTPATDIAEQAFPVPVFIVGMPRSGSTLVEQILGSHSSIGGGGEFSYLADILIAAADAASVPIGRQAAALTDNQVQQIRRSYFSAWSPHVGTAQFFIDKQLNNFWLIGQIARCFPSSPIIDVRRHPFDACFGAFKQLFAQGQEFTYSFKSYAAYHGMYLQIMAHWKTLLPNQIHSIYLEELVQNPKAAIGPVLAGMHLQYSGDMQDFYRNPRVVHSASSEQVRKPISKATGYRFAWQAGDTASMRDALSAAAKHYPHRPIFKPESGEEREQQSPV
jgi:tetratricopeptide (TPR) repeat protein